MGQDRQCHRKKFFELFRFVIIFLKRWTGRVSEREEEEVIIFLKRHSSTYCLMQGRCFIGSDFLNLNILPN